MFEWKVKFIPEFQEFEILENGIFIGYLSGFWLEVEAKLKNATIIME